jgi:serine/tyrosine/threonine adenylyltransferase
LTESSAPPKLSLRFNNTFAAQLPADSEPENTPRQVFDALYSPVRPEPFKAPTLLIYSEAMASTLGLSADEVHSPTFLAAFSGQQPLPEMLTYATRYGGHQFGHWAGQLGDGRAINLGQVEHDGASWHLQLKGAGPTPYSRRGDGFAVLRSSVREFLCSEAMHYLGVPTTRALSLMLTGEKVWRDMFYNGNPQQEPGAVVCRVSPSFTRFGHFEMLARAEEIELQRQLLEYTLRYEDTAWLKNQGLDPEQPEPLGKAVYGDWFKSVCERTAHLILHWMRVGFVHGVMNTDNMSVLGLTIDYGPYGWLEDFDPLWTPNTTDAQGRRYAYGKQPPIAQWNLMKFAQSLFDLVDEAALRDGLNHYATVYEQGWQAMMRNKLGLIPGSATTPEAIAAEAKAMEVLFDDVLALLQRTETDMTLFFRGLADMPLSQEEESLSPVSPSSGAPLTLPAALQAAYYREVPEEVIKDTLAWLSRYQQLLQRLKITDAERKAAMHQVNPKYVLRNYLAQEAIDLAEQGDYSRLHTLLKVLKHPYDEQPEYEHFAEKRPEWARNRAGCSTLSCSS